jgi:hypothetical protein
VGLINTIAQLKDLLPVSGNLAVADILPFCVDAETKFVKPALGATLYGTLKTAAEANSASGETAVLLANARKVVAGFALLNYIPVGQLQISSGGIQIRSDENNKTAFKWQIEDLQQWCSNYGYAKLDELFAYLEEKKGTFTTWVDSTGFTIFYENYIHTAVDFTKHVALLGESRSIFLQLKGIMTQVEDDLILDVLGSAQDVALRTKIKAATTNATEKSAVTLIQRVVAYKSIAKALALLSLKLDERGVLVFDATGRGDNKQYAKTADESTLAKRADYYMSESIAQEKSLVKLLDANLDVFTDYASMIKATPNYTSPDIEDSDNVISFM